MKIAFVIPEFHKTGGTERCVAEIARTMVARGHVVRVFSSKMDETVLFNVKWYRAPLVPRPHLVRFLSFFITNAVARITAELLFRERFDIVHSTGPDVMWPNVTTFHCCAAAMANDLKGSQLRDKCGLGVRFRRWSNIVAYRVAEGFERYVVRRGAGRVLAVSKALGREVEEYYKSSKERLEVVYNGVNLGEFIPADGRTVFRTRKLLGLPKHKFVVLFVGYNWERKGLGTLVKALTLATKGMNKGRQAYLAVVGGQGSDESRRSIQTMLRGNVKFLGATSNMSDIYKACDVCILPSTEEPFGLPILEAMACGLPVIVSRCAGVAEIITDGWDGFLLNDPTDHRELAGRIEALQVNSDLRHSVAINARNTAERYSWDHVADRLEKIYQDVLSEQR